MKRTPKPTFSVQHQEIYEGEKAGYPFNRLSFRMAVRAGDIVLETSFENVIVRNTVTQHKNFTDK